MHTVSDLYTSILSDARHEKESRLDIAGISYGMDKLISGAVYGALHDGEIVGKCNARQIDISFLSDGETIPRMAEMRLYTRLALDGTYSEWIPKGVFYIDTRQTDKETGVVALHGYDAMLKAEEVFLIEGDPGEWPRTSSSVVSAIALRMGVEIDAETVLDDTFLIQYPNDYTMRELLSFIAGANAGNWIVTDRGTLLLTGIWAMPEETSLLVTEDGAAVSIGEVKINV